MSQYIYAFCLTRFCFILFVLNISNLCEIKFLRFIDSIAALPLAQHCDLSSKTRERDRSFGANSVQLANVELEKKNDIR